MSDTPAKPEARVLAELKSIVGEQNATAADHVRYAYSYDMSFVQPKMPDYVVLATEVKQIQDVLKLANRELIPVVPYTSGTNIGGLCIPERGGIILDLKRMNRILTLDVEAQLRGDRAWRLARATRGCSPPPPTPVRLAGWSALFVRRSPAVCRMASAG